MTSENTLSLYLSHFRDLSRGHIGKWLCFVVDAAHLDRVAVRSFYEFVKSSATYCIKRKQEEGLHHNLSSKKKMGTPSVEELSKLMSEPTRCEWGEKIMCPTVKLAISWLAGMCHWSSHRVPCTRVENHDLGSILSDSQDENYAYTAREPSSYAQVLHVVRAVWHKIHQHLVHFQWITKSGQGKHTHVQCAVLRNFSSEALQHG
jgi:hypothetical protein